MSVEFHGDHKTYKFEVNLATDSFGDINKFKTVVSICQSYTCLPCVVGSHHMHHINNSQRLSSTSYVR